jgi:hypothetical protein
MAIGKHNQVYAEKIYLSSYFLAIIRTEREGVEKKRLGESNGNSAPLAGEAVTPETPPIDPWPRLAKRFFPIHLR